MTIDSATIGTGSSGHVGAHYRAKSRNARLVSAAVYLSGAVIGANTAATRQLPSGDVLRTQVTSPQIKANAATLVPNRKQEFMAGTAAAICQCFLPVESARVPQHLRDAIVTIEDHRFHKHRGIDLHGLARSLLLLLTGERQGGSTITMQLAKIMVTGSTRRFPGVISRKLREMIVARRLERLMTKDEIIIAYLNAADFGASEGWTAFGIEQAALKFFGKSASELNLYESALLARVLNGTTRNPHLNPDAAHQGAQLVLRRMVALGYISQGQADRALRVGSRPGKREPARIDAKFYADWLFDELVSLVEGRSLTGHLRFVVGLDPVAQLRAERVLAAASRDISNDSKVQGAMLAMRPDGRVVALVGGRDFRRSQFNRATQAQRQPGSAFKPIVYAAAIEAGFQANSMVEDSPLAPDQGWPANFDRIYRGTVSLNYAMQHSLNAATVRLATQVGLPKIVELAHRVGIAGEFPLNPSIALGSREVSLIALTAAYGAFANAGRRVHPYGTITATDAYGYLFYQRTESSGGPVLDRHTVNTMRTMLRSVVTGGTGRNAQLPGKEWSGGKTGTTQDFRDAWFVGMTDSLITGVWFGNDDGSPMRGITGSGIPALSWRRFNSDLRNPRPIFRAELPRPDEIAVAGGEAGRLPVPLPPLRPKSAFEGPVTGTTPDGTHKAPLPASMSRDQRQVAAYAGTEPPGTIVINTRQRFLYLVQDNGRALRYQVAVGRPGFTWSGTRTITAKREWPDWHPPAAMRQRRPSLPKSVPGGPDNPLGARALYLGSTFYRIHGSNEPHTIGQPVSSGCFRMRNEDVIDLYSRVAVGTQVIVY